MHAKNKIQYFKTGFWGILLLSLKAGLVGAADQTNRNPQSGEVCRPDVLKYMGPDLIIL